MIHFVEIIVSDVTWKGVFLGQNEKAEGLSLEESRLFFLTICFV